MKALSLIQPWAWVVVYGGKRVENRVWNTEYRGPFLIHASRQTTRAYYADVSNHCRRWAPGLRLPAFHQLQVGGIVGRAILETVLEPEEYPTADWRFPNQYGFVLQNVRPLPFQPCKGHQRWWTVPDHLLMDLGEARQREKQASRDQDAADIASGRKTREQVTQENSFLPLDRMGSIDWTKVPPID